MLLYEVQQRGSASRHHCEHLLRDRSLNSCNYRCFGRAHFAALNCCQLALRRCALLQTKVSAILGSFCLALCGFLALTHRRRMLPRSRSLTTTRPMALLTLLALYIGACAGQDGSSEMSPDKPSPSVGGSSRLRVRCTDDSLRLYHNATTCSDEREPESCKMIFTSPFTTNPAGRDPKCDNPLLEDLSKQCRKTCAICCEDPTYACLNDDSKSRWPTVPHPGSEANLQRKLA